MRFFDAHTHIDMKHFKNDVEQVIGRAKKAGLIGMVTSSIGPGSFRRTLGMVKKHSGYIYHSAGCQASTVTLDVAETIVTLTREYAMDLVAVGEVGLDYHWVKDPAKRKAQEPLFLMFIELANELGLPLVIHSRKAEAEAAAILEKHAAHGVLMHCFDGSSDVAQRVSDNGWHITLPANFSRYQSRVNAAKILPLDQILLETDGPYLSPTERRNEPANITLGCQSLAEVLDLPMEHVAEVTTRNAIGFYAL
ncbi:MAG: TatD family hydrolase [Candidatus Thorarchaeota archaeon]|jgi:TatD DNase family protein